MDSIRRTGGRVLLASIGVIIAWTGACSSGGATDNTGGAKTSSVSAPAAGNTLGNGSGSTSGGAAGLGSAGASIGGGSGGTIANKATGSGGAPGMTGNPAVGSGGATAMTGSGGAPMTKPPVMGPPVGTGSTCLQAGNGQYTEPGPYKVATKEVDLGMIEASQHTGKFMIYYPDPLEASCLHPIVAWGNGTGVQGAGVYAFLNNNAASWGMVVAEAEEDNTGSGAFHKAGLDYLLKENADASSMFYGKLSTRAGVSGHSQGGFGATAGSSHPNVVTMAIEGASTVATAKVSVLILTGTMDIVTGAESLVTGAKGPMFVADWEGGDHVTTETVAGYIGGDKGSLQFTRLYAAWFRCFLADDAVACKMFQGGAPDNCGICKDSGWHGLASGNL